MSCVSSICPVNARVVDVLHEDVALAAGPGHRFPTDPRTRILVGEDVVNAVAVVAARSHDEAVHQERLAVDRIDEILDGLVVADGTGLQHDFALVTLGARPVKVELVGL